MAPRCTICVDPVKRDAVDAALLEGKLSLRDVAGQTGTSKSAVERHREHVPKRLTAIVARAEELRAESILGRVLEVEADARRLAAQAERDQDVRAALVGLKLVLDVLGKVHELVTASTKAEETTLGTFLESSEWKATEDALVEALRPHPEALAAVVRALDARASVDSH